MGAVSIATKGIICKAAKEVINYVEAILINIDVEDLDINVTVDEININIIVCDQRQIRWH